MKRVLSVALLLAPVIIALGVVLPVSKDAYTRSTTPPAYANPPEISPRSSIEFFDIPSRLIIEKLGVDVPVEEVGEAPDGRMDVPKDEKNVGWWRLGVKPGEQGNAVLAGHFDNSKGEPSVFYYLNDLKIKDKIKVIDKNGKTIQFEVTEKEYFKDALFPIDLVFGQSDISQLNLITCAGTYDKDKSNYSDRLVVFTKRI